MCVVSKVQLSDMRKMDLVHEKKQVFRLIRRKKFAPCQARCNADRKMPKLSASKVHDKLCCMFQDYSLIFQRLFFCFLK